MHKLIDKVDRFTHKLWKVRKEAYEEAAKQFSVSPDESDPCFRPFLNDPNLWKAAVSDSNVAAQQEGIIALCAFLKYGGRDCALRTRGLTITPMVEKSLSSTRAATKQNALEAILLYIELDVAAPVLEDVMPGLSNKVPKNVAATLNALTAIFHNYGCKTVDPKPVLKALPKVFGAADKNVRAEATNLTVELYRWLQPPPKQERLLRSQQAAAETAAGGDEDDGDAAGEEADAAEEMDAFSLAEPVDITKKIPPNFSDMLASSKWKDRKEAVDALGQALNVPRIKDSDFNEVTRGLAKCMKDANVAVVTQAAQCIELLAKGLRQAFAKHRPTVMQPIMDRLKEKKQTVADALGAALDAVFSSTNLADCLEDIIAYLSNKNPQVKEGTMKFLIRCLRTTRDVPSKPEIASICEAGKKLLSESSPALRDGGAEILGTVMKIIGERAMTPYLDGLDDIRKTKVKEFFETAEVKAKEKPKPAPAAKAPPASAKKIDDLRQERSKFLSEIQELKNQNAGLIEDHTRDVLSIKAKETQLVRARSDAEATEQVNERLRREMDRLKKALNNAEGLNAGSGVVSPRVASPGTDDVGIFRDPGSAAANRNRMSFASTMSEEKENGEMMYPRTKLSPDVRHNGSSASSGRGSPARNFRNMAAYRDDASDSGAAMARERPVSSLPQPSGGGGVESWRRAAEVTSQLKARIEQMKAKQGFNRP
ncbi:hypothetical protein ACCO45_013262 [Purpureocillium lilacinum]|uniref:Uncharacterized protein n=1 Tax=Purpureocillium lilacinum TaxID=33203 RepID=A0ACC4DBW0_PURLI